MVLLFFVILLLCVLFIVGLITLTRKLIPEFDAWWKRADAVDSDGLVLKDILEEDLSLEEKARAVKMLKSKKYKSNKDVIQSILNERRPR